MKYLLINSLKFGGAERVAQILSGADIFDGIILLENEQDFEVSLPVIFLSSHTIKTNSIYKTFFIPIYAWRLRDRVKNGDTIVSFLERANFVNIIFGLFIKTKNIITIHTTISREYGQGLVKRFYYLLIKALYPLADRIVAVSRGIEQDIKKVIAVEKIIIIYNPINNLEIIKKSLEPINDKWDEIFKNKVCVNTGRLVWQKNQKFLIDVFKKAAKKIKGFKLLIIGDGPLRDSLISHAKEEGLAVFSIWESDSLSIDFDIYFVGHQENPFSFESRSSIFLFTSVLEGMPMSVIEAMACGLPIISSDCQSGPREIISPRSEIDQVILEPELGEFGVLLPKTDECDEKLIEKYGNFIVDFINDEKIIAKYKNLSLERAKDFDLQNISKLWKEII